MYERRTRTIAVSSTVRGRPDRGKVLQRRGQAGRVPDLSLARHRHAHPGPPSDLDMRKPIGSLHVD
jgi:hypothetical protein